MDRFLVKFFNFTTSMRTICHVKPKPESIVLSLVTRNWREVQVGQVEVLLMADPDSSGQDSSLPG
jgi:hypothetical protein